MDLDVERGVGAELAVELDGERRGRVNPHPGRALQRNPGIGEMAAPVHRGEPARERAAMCGRRGRRPWRA